MLHAIGRSPSTGAVDAIAGFEACHARIRTFIDLAVRLAEHPEAPPAERAEAARALVRYFEIALPLHVADEDESLAPRLGASGSDELKGALGAMRREHDEIEQMLGELLPAWRALADGAGQRPLDAEEARRLAGALEAHLAREEAMVLPAARRLPAAALSEIAAEVRARRAAPPLGSEAGALATLLAADHDRLDALLARALGDGDAIDRDAFAAFRAGLARHIGMEEKILFPAARAGGDPEIARAIDELRGDHKRLVSLLVPTPTPELVRRIAGILAPHNAREEGHAGVYARCEAVLGGELARVRDALEAAPEVPMRPPYDGPAHPVRRKR